MIKSNYHTHMKYCNHAVGESEDYVKSAVNAGLIELGMSDHAPILHEMMSEEEWKENWCEENMTSETFTKYLKELDELKVKYPQLKIYKALESEYVPGFESFYQSLRDRLDYLNLGVHYFKDGDKIINSYDNITYKNVSVYADTCIEGMKSGLFNTLVHPDLFMYAYQNREGKREFDEEAVKASERILEAAVKYDCYIEINANGLRVSKKHESEGWLYPYRDFWLMARNYPVKILIGSDCHDPSYLCDEYVEEACLFAKELGLTICEKMEIKH